MQFFEQVKNFIWIIATLLIFISGIYFTLKLNFVQFKFNTMMKCLNKKQNNKSAINSKDALLMVLGGRVGVGSIAGVALAIYRGGIGTIFWMWITAFVSASICFCETVLGIKYKELDGEKIYIGGPSYYLKKGLNNKTLSYIYSILILVCYIGGFISIQANTIAVSTLELFNIDKILIGSIISIIILIIIFGGIIRISKVTSKLVPFMIIIYVISGIFILIVNYTQIPSIISDIIKSAFNFNAIRGGILGTILIGIQRGIFSNEAGMGTGSIASSIVDTDNSAEQGYIQMIGIYITTLIICTVTGIVIITSNYESINLLNINGIEITQYAFKYHLGHLGNIIIFISIIMFAFSTILTGYYYSESSLKSINNKISPKAIIILKILIVIVVFVGSIVSANILWLTVDLLSAFLVIINIYCLLKMRKEIREEYDKTK